MTRLGLIPQIMDITLALNRQDHGGGDGETTAPVVTYVRSP